MTAFDDFQKLDIRIGTVVEATPFPEARVPAIKLIIDFGELGLRRSSAQITRRYTPEALVGRQVAAVVNMPPRRIAGISIVGVLLTLLGLVLVGAVLSLLLLVLHRYAAGYPIPGLQDWLLSINMTWAQNCIKN